MDKKELKLEILKIVHKAGVNDSSISIEIAKRYLAFVLDDELSPPVSQPKEIAKKKK